MIDILNPRSVAHLSVPEKVLPQILKLKFGVTPCRPHNSVGLFRPTSSQLELLSIQTELYSRKSSGKKDASSICFSTSRARTIRISHGLANAIALETIEQSKITKCNCKWHAPVLLQLFRICPTVAVSNWWPVFCCKAHNCDQQRFMFAENWTDTIPTIGIDFSFELRIDGTSINRIQLGDRCHQFWKLTVRDNLSSVLLLMHSKLNSESFCNDRYAVRAVPHCLAKHIHEILVGWCTRWRSTSITRILGIWQLFTLGYRWRRFFRWNGWWAGTAWRCGRSLKKCQSKTHEIQQSYLLRYYCCCFCDNFNFTWVAAAVAANAMYLNWVNCWFDTGTFQFVELSQASAAATCDAKNRRQVFFSQFQPVTQVANVAEKCLMCNVWVKLPDQTTCHKIIVIIFHVKLPPAQLINACFDNLRRRNYHLQ